MVRLHLPRAPTYRALLPLPLPRLRASASASVPLAGGGGGSAMSTTAQTVADQKRALRSDVRRALKALSPNQRASEDLAIQGTILNSSWFKASKRLCAYISCVQLREVDTSKILVEVLSPNSGESYVQIRSLVFLFGNNLVIFKDMMDEQRVFMFLEWKIRIAI